MAKSRRALRYSRLQEIVPDLDRLLAGHRTVGQWSLAQICHHLSTTIGYSIDGYPGSSFPRVLRRSFGRLVWFVMSKSERIKEGVKIPATYLPAPDLEAQCEADALRSAIDRFVAHDGPFKPHPFICDMTREQWHRFHCIHSAHHLSFAIPLDEPRQAS